MYQNIPAKFEIAIIDAIQKADAERAEAGDPMGCYLATATVQGITAWADVRGPREVEVGIRGFGRPAWISVVGEPFNRIEQ